MDDTLATQFHVLFAGRKDAYGTEEGGCAREPVTTDHYAAHLRGKRPFGIYPMVPDDDGNWMVKWGCIDLDVQAPHKRRWDYDTPADAYTAALNLYHTLEAFGITSWIESTKSGGCHVWVFATAWVPAATMRRCLLVACNVADVPPTEVNPKNEQFDTPDTLGNYVRLPYPGWFTDHVTRPIIDPNDQHPLGIYEFADMALAGRATPDALTTVADLYRPPATVIPIRNNITPTRYHEAIGTMSRRLRAVVDNGPLRQEDRSGWLYYVARLCADDGLPIGEACAIVALCDDLHTHKFTGRNDGPTRIAQTVQKAYA